MEIHHLPGCSPSCASDPKKEATQTQIWIAGSAIFFRSYIWTRLEDPRFLHLGLLDHLHDDIRQWRCISWISWVSMAISPTFCGIYSELCGISPIKRYSKTWVIDGPCNGKSEKLRSWEPTGDQPSFIGWQFSRVCTVSVLAMPWPGNGTVAEVSILIQSSTRLLSAHKADDVIAAVQHGTSVDLTYSESPEGLLGRNAPLRPIYPSRVRSSSSLSSAEGHHCVRIRQDWWAWLT